MFRVDERFEFREDQPRYGMDLPRPFKSLGVTSTGAFGFSAPCKSATGIVAATDAHVNVSLGLPRRGIKALNDPHIGVKSKQARSAAKQNAFDLQSKILTHTILSGDLPPQGVIAMVDDVKVLDIVSDQSIPLDNREDYERTTWIYVQNNTPLAIKICFFQILSRLELPEPYIKDTGVFVGGVDMAPGASVAVDPWDAGGRNAPIAGTRAKATVKVVIPQPGGNIEQDVSLSFPDAEEGSYYPQFGWTLTTSAKTTIDGQSVQIIDAHQLTSGIRYIKGSSSK